MTAAFCHDRDNPALPCLKRAKGLSFTQSDRLALERPAMRTLIVDNYDSFTHNILHLFARVTGQEPVIVRNDAGAWDGALWRDLRRQGFDAVVIGPGPGHPGRDGDFGVSADVIRSGAWPLLGICLGHQGIAALAGAEVVAGPEPVHGKVSLVHHTGEGLFAGLPNPFPVGRYHSLVARRPLPQGLEETAWTAQDHLVMGLAARSAPVWGVQFHPESILTPDGERLIANFRGLALAARSHRPVFQPPVAEEPEPMAFPVPELSHTSRVISLCLPVEIDTEAAFLTLFGASPHAFWLDGALSERSRSRWSYLGKAESALGCDAFHHPEQARDILDALASLVPHAAEGTEPPVPFCGGYVGWFGYEFAQAVGGPVHRASPTPDGLLMRVKRLIAVDHQTGQSWLIAPAGDEGWIAQTRQALAQMAAPSPPETGEASSVVFTADRGRDTYLSDVAQCLEWIRQGETYQVCLTNEITCQLQLDPLTLYRIVRRQNAAPYAAYLKWPGGAVLSASPERFLQVDRHGGVETKPIKGTAPRGTTPAHDAALAEALRDNVKERAENTMIVDLLRNDLSRVCVPGSVTVPALCAIETYATVHQLVSTVRGRLRPGEGIAGLIRATFPGGSMTGCPKHRTLDLIDRLEQRPRGIYSGALGWIGDDGAADLSIVIRTIVMQGDRLSIGVGGGIVAQSVPEREHAEMLLKAQAPMRAIVTAATGGWSEERCILKERI
ncbi:Para-aminobenzoate synthase glutamine amidotransferase component II [Granulibacter bethesdensis]|nr:Para-aminobenzoate synthase glutamine amidotransferase component II [Granulibacter bethesdensis]